MNIVDVYTKKDYKCNKCNALIYYGKIAKDNGEFYTTDGNPPNGKFGKESNVLSGAVDAAVQDRLHDCSKHYILKKIDELNNGASGSQQKITQSVTPRIQYPDGCIPRAQFDAVTDIVIESIKHADSMTRMLYPDIDEDSTLFAQIRNTMADKVLAACTTLTMLQEIAKVKEALEDGS